MACVDLSTLVSLLGHTSIHTTMRYVHLAEEHKRAATAKIERLKTVSAIDLARRSQGGTYKSHYSRASERMEPTRKSLTGLVGARGFEPWTPAPQGKLQITK
jgi:hypothetical protein